MITAVDVAGNRSVEKAAVLATISSRPGTVFSAERVRNDIIALYRMGTFEDIRVEKTAADGGVRLLFKVTEKSNITKISFEGNKKVKEDKLRELLDIKPLGRIDEARIAETVEKIRKHYEGQGYHLVEITTEEKPVPGTDGRELVFQIREHGQVKIRRVRFLGNRAFSDRALRKLMKSREQGGWSWLTGSGKYGEEAIQRDVAFLAYHYQNHGYLKVRVGAPQVYLSRDRKGIDLTFHITEGAPYKIRAVDVQGDILTTREEMIARLKTVPGHLYSREKLEEDLQTFSQMYGDQGYAFALIDPLIKSDDENRTADITFAIDRGKKVTIEKINVSGNTITRDKVIRRELLVKENSLFNETKLRESRRRVEALGYFEEVNFATPRGSSDDQIVLNITVKEKPTGTFTIGAGFSSAESFIFNASVAKNNFFGYGVSGQASMELSSKRQFFVLSAEDPYFLDSSWILGVSGFRLVRVLPDFDRRSFGGTLTLGRRIFDYSEFRFLYNLENVDVGAFRTAVPAAFAGNLSGLTSSGTLDLRRDTRNNRLFPSQGMFQELSGEYAGLGGDSRYLRVIGNFRWYRPLYKAVVGKFNLTAANIASLNRQPVPLFERFFMGGINSLRGYGFNAIGPSTRISSAPAGGDNRFVYGGNKMLQMNFELELPIYDPAGFKAVTFLDSGQSYAEDESVSLRELRSDYGFGLRWNSPMGPLRFEWGLPIRRRPGEDSVVFNFAIGSFF